METQEKTTWVIDGKEVTYTRLFNAPRDLLWEAWTNPDLLAKWFGPDGFSITTSEFTFEENGSWIFMMHGPDGTDYPNNVRFLTIDEPESLSYQTVGDGETKDVSFVTRVFFEAQGEQTLFRMQQVFGSVEMLQHVAEKYGAIEGGVQTIGRLAVLVEGM